MSDVIEVTDGNFETEVLRSEVPVLVDFSATWCGPCKKLEPLVREVAREYDGRLKVVHVDVDQARENAARLGVLSVPTLMWFRDGEVREQIVGLVAKSEIVARVDKVL